MVNIHDKPNQTLHDFVEIADLEEQYYARMVPQEWVEISFYFDVRPINEMKNNCNSYVN